MMMKWHKQESTKEIVANCSSILPVPYFILISFTQIWLNFVFVSSKTCPFLIDTFGDQNAHHSHPVIHFWKPHAFRFYHHFVFEKEKSVCFIVPLCILAPHAYIPNFVFLGPFCLTFVSFFKLLHLYLFAR